MPDLLEQSIIDAKILKETAIKNAENLLIEKYTDKIKEAVSSILEQDEEEDFMDEFEDEEGGEEEGFGDDISSEEVPSSTVDIPLAATDGLKLCVCPEEEEEIEIDFSELEKEMASGEEPETIEREEIVDKIPAEDEEEIMEEDLEGILEKLTVDAAPVSDGWIGSTEEQKEEATDKTLATAEDTKNKEEEEENPEREKKLLKIGKELNETKEKINCLKKENKELRRLLLEASKNLQSINLSNAKLLYTNKIVMESSLNERQKENLIESLSKVKSIEEAKLVYESLREMGSSKSKIKEPKSLQEVVNKSLPMMLKSERRTEVRDTVKDRMKVLAGIKK